MVVGFLGLFSVLAFVAFLAILCVLLVLYFDGGIEAMKAGAEAICKCLSALRGMFRPALRRRR